MGAAGRPTAPYVKGVIERHAWLKVAPDVERWLAHAAVGWVGRVGAGKRLGAGRFVLETISGELPEELDALAESAGGGCGCRSAPRSPRRWASSPGARFDERALRCAHRLRVGLEPAPATLSLIESVGEPRLKLDVNWDPETIPAFLALPACEAHGRSLPVDPYLLEPLEHYLRTFGVEVAPNGGRRARAPAARARCGDRGRPPLARPRRPGARDRGGARRRAAPVPARRRALRAARAAAVPRRRAGPRQDGAGAGGDRGRRRLPGGGRLPGVAEAQLAARDRALAAPPLRRPWCPAPARRRRSRRSRSSTTRSSTPTAPGSRSPSRARSCSTSRTTSRTRAPSARGRCGGSPRGCRRARCGSRSPARR